MNTAVEWIEETIGKDNMGNFLKDVLQKAKEMEKEQIVNFADKYDAYIVQGGPRTAEQYYNETYKSE
jgi:hypothetical protein